MKLAQLAPDGSRLEGGIFDDRRRLNRAYLLSLQDDALL